jgi:hypothetical protein
VQVLPQTSFTILAGAVCVHCAAQKEEGERGASAIVVATLPSHRTLFFFFFFSFVVLSCANFASVFGLFFSLSLCHGR